MPTIHYSDSTSLSQLGVKDAPKSADEIRTKLKRDQSYFDIPISRADNDEEQRELDSANDDNEKQQSNQKSITVPNESKTTSDESRTTPDTTDIQIDTDKSSAEKKATSIARKKKRTLDKSITSSCDNDTISNEDNQGDYDVPIAERLKLRREKRKAETNSTAKTATHENIGTPIAERLKRRRTNNTPDAVKQDTTTSKSTRKRKASSSLNSNKATEVTTPKSSVKKTCASKDLDYSKTGIRQLASGNKWSVEIGYHKKRCYPGSYEDKEHAVLANKVAREFLLATRDLELTDEEIQSNIDLCRNIDNNCILCYKTRV